MTRQQLCEVLLGEGLIARPRLDAALEALARSHTPRRLVAWLVDRGEVDEVRLAAALAKHLAVPIASLELFEAQTGCLALLPRDVCERFSMFPVYVRREPTGPATLFVAMDDPTWEEALFTASIVAGLPARPLVAARSAIATAIQDWYSPRRAERPTRPARPAADNDTVSVEYPSELLPRAANG